MCAYTNSNEAAVLVQQICRLNKVNGKFEQTHITRAIHSINATLSNVKELHYYNGLSDIFILDMELHVKEKYLWT